MTTTTANLQLSGPEENAQTDWSCSIDVCRTGQYLCANHAAPFFKFAWGRAALLEWLLRQAWSAYPISDEGRTLSGQSVTADGNLEGLS